MIRAHQPLTRRAIAKRAGGNMQRHHIETQSKSDVENHCWYSRRVTAVLTLFMFVPAFNACLLVHAVIRTGWRPTVPHVHTYLYSISHRIPYRHLLAFSCQLLLLAQHLHPKYPGVAFKFHSHHHLTFHPSNPFFIDASLFSPRKIIVDATAHSVPCCQGYNCSGTSTSSGLA